MQYTTRQAANGHGRRDEVPLGIAFIASTSCCDAYCLRRPFGAWAGNRMASPGSSQFVPPGRYVVLRTAPADAQWVTSGPTFSQHAWRSAWFTNLFRNGSACLSSTLSRLHALSYEPGTGHDHLWQSTCCTQPQSRLLLSVYMGYTRLRVLVALQLLQAATPRRACPTICRCPCGQCRPAKAACATGPSRTS